MVRQLISGIRQFLASFALSAFSCVAIFALLLSQNIDSLFLSLPTASYRRQKEVVVLSAHRFVWHEANVGPKKVAFCEVQSENESERFVQSTKERSGYIKLIDWFK